MENNVLNAVRIGEKVFGQDVIWQQHSFELPLIYSSSFIIYKFYYHNNPYLLIVSKEDDVSIDLLKGIYHYIKNKYQEVVIAYLPNRRVFNALHDDLNYLSYDGKYNLNNPSRFKISKKAEYTKATQLVVKFLLFNKIDSYSTRYIAQKLGMSNTTIKRAYDFLEEIEAITRTGISTSSVEYSIISKKDLLSKVEEYFIFPYRRVIRTFLNKEDIQSYSEYLYISGDNALSKYTELADMKVYEYAVNQKNFEKISYDGITSDDGDLYNIEEFIYDPNLFVDDHTIDILDTYIIISQRYKNTGDTRIKEAIKELRRKIINDNR